MTHDDLERKEWALELDVTPADVRRFHRYHLWRYSRRAPLAIGLILAVVAGASLGAYFFPDAFFPRQGLDPAAAAWWTFVYIGGLFAVFLIALFWIAARLAVERSRDMGGVGKLTCVLSPEAVVTHNERIGDSRRLWAGIAAVVETPEAIYVYLNRMQAFMVPRRAFGSDAEFQHCAKTLRKWHAAARTVVG